VRGNSNPQLLDWLNLYIFPEEIRSFDPLYARSVAKAFFTDMKKNGSSTALIYVSASPVATDIAFEEAENAGVRAWIGNIMMDCNAPAELLLPTKNIIDHSFALHDKWKDRSNLLNYIFTPRFAPVCSRELMTETAKYAKKNGVKIQTHLSENANEIEWVKQLFPECNSYADVYFKYNILGNETVMAHCLHLNPSELRLMQETDTRIAHCPESNFFLKSGHYPITEIESSQIKYGLGSDVGAGTCLSMPYHMRMMEYMQSKQSLQAAKTFYHATLGSADILNRKETLGSIEIGKQADIAFWKFDSVSDTANGYLQKLMYTPDKYLLSKLMINGVMQID